MMTRKIPSLVDLCVRMAIDNVRYLGDVGETDYHLLDRILCHCTIDQLTHIENSTSDRDLSPVTDKLWKKFYKVSFGENEFNKLIETLRGRKVTPKWKELYEAKLDHIMEASVESGGRTKLLYQQEEAKRKARQVKLCSKVPPSSKKRSFSGGANAINVYNTKSNIMKKAKLDFINSREVKNIAAMKTVVQRTRSIPSKVKPVTTSGFSASSSSSSSNKMFKPPVRRRF